MVDPLYHYLCSILDEGASKDYTPTAGIFLALLLRDFKKSWKLVPVQLKIRTYPINLKANFFCRYFLSLRVCAKTSYEVFFRVVKIKVAGKGNDK